MLKRPGVFAGNLGTTRGPWEFQTIHRGRELELDIVDALLGGQRRAQQAGRKNTSKPDTFARGVAWVETMLIPSIRQAASALEAHGVTIRLDTNLDRRSTNHAHADFWLATKDDSIQGPKYSINALGDEIMLYKAGASGRSLGPIDKVGTAELDALLASAAEEFGQLV
jgi:hypothetical protein